MRFSILPIILIAALVLAGCSSGQSREELRAGIIMPLSGDYAFLGSELQRGIELRAQEAEAQGLNITRIYEDNQNQNARLTVTAANKLISMDDVDILILPAVQEAAAVGPIVNEQQVPALVLWDSNKLIAGSGPYVFSNGFSTELAGETMATYAYDELGLRKVAIIRHEDPWARMTSERFTQVFEDKGGQIVYAESVPMDTADYRTPVLKIKQLEPDAVYMPLFPPTSANFVVQLRQSGVNATILAGDVFVQDIVTQVSDAAEGAYNTNIYPENPDELHARYKETYGTEPIDLAIVSVGYEGMDKVVDAYASGRPLRAALDDIFGPSRSAERRERVYKVVNGTFTPMDYP